MHKAPKSLESNLPDKVYTFSWGHITTNYRSNHRLGSHHLAGGWGVGAGVCSNGGASSGGGVGVERAPPLEDTATSPVGSRLPSRAFFPRGRSPPDKLPLPSIRTQTQVEEGRAQGWVGRGHVWTLSLASAVCGVVPFAGVYAFNPSSAAAWLRANPATPRRWMRSAVA